MTSRQLRRRKVAIGVAFCLGDFEAVVLLVSAALGLAFGCGLSLISYVDENSRVAEFDLPAARNFTVAIVLGVVIGSSVDISVWPFHMRYDDTLIPQILGGFIVTFVYIAWPRRVELTKEEQV